MTGPTGSCAGHAGLGAELRSAALLALDRIGPALDRVRAEPPTQTQQACAVCPVCAVIAALHGERPELAVRLAEHAAGLVMVLRAALEEGGGHATPGDPPTTEPSPETRMIHRIHVDRVDPRR